MIVSVPQFACPQNPGAIILRPRIIMGSKWGRIHMWDRAWYIESLLKYLLLLFVLPSHLITAWHKLSPRIACLVILLFASVNQPFCLVCNARLILQSSVPVCPTALPPPFPPFLPHLPAFVSYQGHEVFTLAASGSRGIFVFFIYWPRAVRV